MQIVCRSVTLHCTFLASVSSCLPSERRSLIAHFPGSKPNFPGREEYSPFRWEYACFAQHSQNPLICMLFWVLSFAGSPSVILFICTNAHGRSSTNSSQISLLLFSLSLS